MAMISLIVTLLAAVPTNIQLFRQRSKYMFILTLFNTAAAFFLFSFQVSLEASYIALSKIFDFFQVHEKSILLISLPAMSLFFWWPSEMLWFLEVSVFSMIPLLERDNLIAPTIGTLIIFYLTFTCKYFKLKDRRIYQTLSEALMTFIVIGFLTIKPPTNLPDIWPLIISVVSCAHISVFLGWGLYRQFCQYFKNHN